MASVINSSISPAGLIQSSDGTSVLIVQTGGLDAILVDSDQNVVVNNDITISGNALVGGANVITTNDVDTANVLYSANIGDTVQAYDDDTAKLDEIQTFTAQQTFVELKETVHELANSGTVILDPANGSIQFTSLANNITFTDSIDAGQSLILHIDDGVSHTVTFPTTTWVTAAGNTAPTLTANDTVVFWKIDTTLYGAYVGSYASA